MVGLIPLFAVCAFGEDIPKRLPDFARRVAWFITHKPELATPVAHLAEGVPGCKRLLSVPRPEQMRRILEKVLDETEFLSPHGLRSLSAHHRDHPLEIDLGGSTARLGYEPAESATGLFGGNSNWRGPVWFPLNYLAIEALRRYHRCLGDDFTVEMPTGSGTRMTLEQVADDLCRRLVRLFLNDHTGRRPAFGPAEMFQTHPRWHDLLTFSEYFHGDTGAGLGASHQTGWTALVLDLILETRRSG